MEVNSSSHLICWPWDWSPGASPVFSPTLPPTELQLTWRRDNVGYLSELQRHWHVARTALAGILAGHSSSSSRIPGIRGAWEEAEIVWKVRVLGTASIQEHLGRQKQGKGMLRWAWMARCLGSLDFSSMFPLGAIISLHLERNCGFIGFCKKRKGTITLNKQRGFFFVCERVLFVSLW